MNKNDMSSDLDYVRAGIREAQASYELHLGHVDHPVMRSFELDPRQSLTDSRNRSALVTTLHSKRSRRLTERMAQIPALPMAGRLLIYYPDLSLSDGAAQLAPNGFFDSDNEPPWDTWVFCARDERVNNAQDYATYLLSWVPSDFTDVVERGIEINPERCLEWASESGQPFAKELKKGGLF